MAFTFADFLNGVIDICFNNDTIEKNKTDPYNIHYNNHFICLYELESYCIEKLKTEIKIDNIILHRKKKMLSASIKLMDTNKLENILEYCNNKNIKIEIDNNYNKNITIYIDNDTDGVYLDSVYKTINNKRSSMIIYE